MTLLPLLLFYVMRLLMVSVIRVVRFLDPWPAIALEEVVPGAPEEDELVR